MASSFDESDFVDGDYQSSAKSAVGVTSTAHAGSSLPRRPPTREELEVKVGEAHQKLEELRRQQEELHRERAALEEARRRRLEFQTGREELVHGLTRAVGVLEEAEFNARRDAEQMSRSLAGLRDALIKVEGLHEEAWTDETWQTELTRALTTLENARHEFNGARLKWSVLNGVTTEPAPAEPLSDFDALVGKRDFKELCKLGLALSWPVAVVGLLGFLVMLILLLRH